ARELASRGITVNAVAPGFIDTDMTRALNEEQRAALLGQIPAGRLGAPEEVAAAVLFLVSPQAAYITGETLHVNGGVYMPEPLRSGRRHDPGNIRASFASKNNHSRGNRASGRPGGVPLQYRARCSPEGAGEAALFQAYIRTNR